ncbi:MAG TPA: SRPBCC family protein [Kineosporiaceae bacterium]|nr:SRPBCC family protein [Kineosporiaceae bacterium]
MARQEATTVVAVSLDAVEARLTDVSRWPEFVTGLESVEPAGFERYRFTVAARGRRRTLHVCVVPHPAEHRISWRALEGPRYVGELRLRAVDDRHTRIDLTMTIDPEGLMDGLREIVGGEPMAELTIQHIDAFVSRAPQSDPAE